jgi:hypothetical protein
MVENILHKDPQDRFRFRRMEDGLLVVRGIPYTGEYDESETLELRHGGGCLFLPESAPSQATANLGTGTRPPGEVIECQLPRCFRHAGRA